MGLFDFLEGVCKFAAVVVDEGSTLFEGIAEDTKQLGDELLHCHDDSYVSPYAVKNKAAEIIDRADTKLYNAQERYRRHMEQVRKELGNNLNHKTRLYGRLNGLQTRHNIASIVSFAEMNSPTFLNKVDFQLGEMLGIFGGELRREAANSYLEDAKDYKVAVQREIARIDRFDAKLSALEQQLFVEEVLLRTLEWQIEQKTQAQCYEMAQQIRRLLDTAMLDASGNLKNDYLAAYEMLKRLG